MVLDAQCAGGGESGNGGVSAGAGSSGQHKIGWKGVSEYKIDFGPGYRIYFGQEGETLIILLGGGSKKSQPGDIRIAHMRWAVYKSRKQTR